MNTCMSSGCRSSASHADCDRRYDAPRWIRLETQNINNFDRFPDVVRDFNSKYHTNHQVDDLLHNLEVVERMWEFLNPLQIPLVGLVPYKQPTSPGGNGHEIIDYETEGTGVVQVYDCISWLTNYCRRAGLQLRHDVSILRRQLRQHSKCYGKGGRWNWLALTKSHLPW